MMSNSNCWINCIFVDCDTYHDCMELLNESNLEIIKKQHLKKDLLFLDCCNYTINY